jgi:hypothetical protein
MLTVLDEAPSDVRQQSLDNCIDLRKPRQWLPAPRNSIGARSSNAGTLLMPFRRLRNLAAEHAKVEAAGMQSSSRHCKQLLEISRSSMRISFSSCAERQIDDT